MPLAATQPSLLVTQQGEWHDPFVFGRVGAGFSDVGVTAVRRALADVGEALSSRLVTGHQNKSARISGLERSDLVHGPTGDDCSQYKMLRARPLHAIPKHR